MLINFHNSLNLALTHQTALSVVGISSNLVENDLGWLVIYNCEVGSIKTKKVKVISVEEHLIELDKVA